MNRNDSRDAQADGKTRETEVVPPENLGAREISAHVELISGGKP